MRMATARQIGGVVDTLLDTGARRATKFLSPRTVIRASRRRYRGRKSGKPHYDTRKYEVTLTIGSPNHADRRFIKACKKAGEPFPIKKTRLSFARA